MSSANPRRLLAGFVLAYFAIRFGQVALGAVLPAVIETFRTDAGTLGLALSGMWVAYALVQLPSGALGDRFGERPVILAAVGLATAAAAGIAVVPSLPLLVVAVVVLGVGSGLYYNAATALLARSVEGIGRGIGLHRIGGQGAGLVAPVVAAGLAVRVGWRAAFIVAAVVGGVTVAVLVRGVRPVTPARPDRPLRAVFDPGRLRELLTRPGIAYATAVAGIGEFVSTATSAFLVTVLVQHHGLPVDLAGAVLGGYFAALVAAQPLVGWTSDRVGRDPALGLVFGSGILGYGLLPSVTGLPALGGAVVLCGVAMSWSPAIQARVLAGLDRADRGPGFGLVRTGYILLGAVGTAVTGTIADAAGWVVALRVLVGLLLVGLLLVAAAILASHRRARPAA